MTLDDTLKKLQKVIFEGLEKKELLEKRVLNKCERLFNEALEVANEILKEGGSREDIKRSVFDFLHKKAGEVET